MVPNPWGPRMFLQSTVDVHFQSAYTRIRELYGWVTNRYTYPIWLKETCRSGKVAKEIT